MSSSKRGNDESDTNSSLGDYIPAIPGTTYPAFWQCLIASIASCGRRLFLLVQGWHLPCRFYARLDLHLFDL